MNLWILSHVCFIVYIYMDYFLIFQLRIIIYIAYIHMEYFLIVRYKISIYSLHTHELFLNIFIWDNKTIFNVSHFFLYITYVYTHCFLIFWYGISIYVYIHINYFLNSWCVINLQHFTFLVYSLCNAQQNFVLGRPILGGN
jgi:hypothetical protein